MLPAPAGCNANGAPGGDGAPGGVPQYLTSRDAAALLGVPEPQVRQLIWDGTVAGFRGGGYWIASGAAVARYAASAEGALARLRADFPGWRIGTLSWRYFAITNPAPARQAVVFTARTVDELWRKLDGWQTDNAPARSSHGRGSRRPAPAAETASPPCSEAGLP